MTEKILIANRGEVACRIIRTAKKMGLKTVAVYSEADINSLHVALADESVLLGGALSSESYLNVPKIISACKTLGVKYVHPGWGFLSENWKFAQALEKENISFVGPSSKAIKFMGDKIYSKKLATESNVSVIPSEGSTIDTVEKAKEIAKKIKYPVILKAAAGGGGKGIRIIHKEIELKSALESVRNEAKNSFGDDRIFMEKFIVDPRHVEIQIIGDKHGNVICLGDRDCSVQRNNQKIIEESPCPVMDARTRNKMYAQAVALAKKVEYYSAGTLEFLMDKDNNFYFMEMNTRLQVEHTVSEMVTGLDLVEVMINVAKGEELPFKQTDIKLNGHAIECRINAEDPSKNFMPSIGRINKYIEPLKNDKDVRVDTSVYEGYTISMFYDNMIAKLITRGKDRKDAIEKMQNALSGFYIDGITTNIHFLEIILNNEKFKSGIFNTAFIKNEFSEGIVEDGVTKDEIEVLLGGASFLYITNMKKTTTINNGDIFENGLKLICNANEIRYTCNITETPKGIGVEYENNFIKVDSEWNFNDNIFRAKINNKEVNVKILKNNGIGGYQLQYNGSTLEINILLPHIAELEQYMPPKPKDVKPTELKSPITGNVIKMFVKKGDKVNAGGELLTIEAMKMENIIRTDYDVMIKSVNCKEKDLVNTDDILIEFEEVK
ncbi:MAG: acetyl-CoA carboxylase biotin carboxylase subunit [Rickettsiales bacterium]|jgi:propionyl-CoA carboxylase alpha chain|nr:acetyl-CoA carboxylase biotin carboxylase subunit [Rickettsiales bacterium]